MTMDMPEESLLNSDVDDSLQPSRALALDFAARTNPTSIEELLSGADKVHSYLQTGVIPE